MSCDGWATDHHLPWWGSTMQIQHTPELLEARPDRVLDPTNLLYPELS